MQCVWRDFFWREMSVGSVKRVTLYTIGFTEKSAETFFGLLQQAGVKRVWDVRLNNVSQLAAFAKREDLRYFARELCSAGYVHAREMAPTPAMLDEYRKGGKIWDDYEKQFLELMKERAIEQLFSPAQLHGGCLLCSEAKPHHCHRRLVAEYLQRKWKNSVEIKRLG